MRVSEPEVVERLTALYGPSESVLTRPIGPTLMVCKYLADRDTLGTLTSRAMSRMK